MSRHIPMAAKDGKLISWFQQTNLLHPHVATACNNFIKWNFEVVAHGKDFVDLEMEHLIYLLNADDLVVTDECTLFL